MRSCVNDSGDIEPGLPSFQLPHFTANRIGENGTSIELSFGDILSEIGSAVGLIPLIAILEQIAIAKAFGKPPVFCSVPPIGTGNRCNRTGYLTVHSLLARKRSLFFSQRWPDERQSGDDRVGHRQHRRLVLRFHGHHGVVRSQFRHVFQWRPDDFGQRLFR